MTDFRKIELGTDMVDMKPARINIRILNAATGEVLYTGHNVIVNVVKWLFARLMANALPNSPAPPYTLGSTQTIQAADPLYGIWGLALGAGSPSWAQDPRYRKAGRLPESF